MTSTATRRLLTAAALLGGGLGLLGACTDDDPAPQPRPEPTVSVGHAQQVYGPLVADTVDAVAAVAGEPSADPGPETIWYDAELDSCTYSSSRFEFGSVFGEDVAWDDVREAVGDVLAERGFELTGQLDIPGGHNGFDAVADDGARLEVRSKLGNPSTLQLDAPVDGSCSTGNDSETLPPLVDEHP